MRHTWAAMKHPAALLIVAVLSFAAGLAVDLRPAPLEPLAVVRDEAAVERMRQFDELDRLADLGAAPAAPVERQPVGPTVAELEDQLAKAWQQMANFERLAYDNAPRDALALAVGVTVEEADRWTMRSHFVDNAEELQLALRAVGARELWKMMGEERDWLRVHADKRKELTTGATPDVYAFQQWARAAALEFTHELQRRGLPFPLTENFRRIVSPEGH